MYMYVSVVIKLLLPIQLRNQGCTCSLISIKPTERGVSRGGARGP